MGIKNYKSNLIKFFPEILVKKPYGVYYLCIDLNMILHQICHKSNNKVIFEQLLKKELNKIIRKLKPKFVAIFTDGQAILAKAHTQIKRRNKYLYQKSSGISPLNLTPGTPFMHFVDDIIRHFLLSLKIKSYYSSSVENNEGEIKLFNWLKEQQEEKTVILGNDSDLVVLCLASCPLTNLFIYNNGECISIPILLKSLSNLVKYKFSLKNHPVRLDFVLISLFQGNDYNNRVSNFKNLLNSYKKIMSTKNGFLINKNGSLNLSLIKKLFNNINDLSTISNTKEEVNYFFKCIQWNLMLYTNSSINNFIPESISVSISSILKFFPKKLPNLNSTFSWLDPDVYLLLLMPIVGKSILPNHLKKYLDDDSPIRDLFPDPCPDCIKWKKKLKELNQLINISDDEELKKKVSKANCDYRLHLIEFHDNSHLQIERIKEALENF